MDPKTLAYALVEALTESLDLEAAVRESLHDLRPGRLHLLSIGKAASEIARYAYQQLGETLCSGLVITKYGHTSATVDYPFEVIEAGHPVPDAESLRAGQRALDFVDALGADDHLLFFVSGGGSAVMESLVDGIGLEDLQEINSALLKSGVDIVEINGLRKKLSKIKGGRLAHRAAPARITQFLLSDVLGDDPASIASGPCALDLSSLSQAHETLKRIGLAHRNYPLSAPPESLPEIETRWLGSVQKLIRVSQKFAAEHNLPVLFLSDTLNCEAREAGRFLAAVARAHSEEGPLLILAAGETVVHIVGNGLGGRNQELALAAAAELPERAVILSFASDGNDGPTDAAGAILSHADYMKIANPKAALANNDSYHALNEVSALIKTGPTGNNINDLYAIFIGSR